MMPLGINSYGATIDKPSSICLLNLYIKHAMDSVVADPLKFTSYKKAVVHSV